MEKVIFVAKECTIPQLGSINSEYSGSRFGTGKKSKRAFTATANNLAIVFWVFFSAAAFDNTYQGL